MIVSYFLMGNGPDFRVSPNAKLSVKKNIFLSDTINKASSIL